MNSRLTMALAVAGGYVLGRTKKAKFAFGVATMVAGKRLKLNPQALATFAKDQLSNNPQFKELGDQLRTDLRGAGKAATGALVNRQVNALADRLHERTLDVRDQLSGASDSAKETAGDAASTTRDTARKTGEDAAGAATKTARKALPGSRRAGGRDEAEDADAREPDGEESGERADGEHESEAPRDSRSAGSGEQTAGGARKSAGRAKKSAGTAKKSAAERPAAKQSRGRATGKKAASSSSGTARSSSRSSTAKRTGTASAAKPASTRAKSSGAKGGRSRG
ncbi:DNA primase [Streptomyces sp. PU-14G]|uniref:DNA primase n=1 Tax=Streptomyces sp. PU-14G TaxID=2800808 RepID=UPI0034DFA2CE